MDPVDPVSRLLTVPGSNKKDGRMQIGLTAKTSARRRFASRDNSREKSMSGLETSAKLAPDGRLVFLQTWTDRFCVYCLLSLNDD